jgi:hypothetical protein
MYLHPYRWNVQSTNHKINIVSMPPQSMSTTMTGMLFLFLSTMCPFSILETNSEYRILVTSSDVEAPILEREILVRQYTIVPLSRRQLISDVVCPTNPNADVEASETLSAAAACKKGHDHVPFLTC